VAASGSLQALPTKATDIDDTCMTHTTQHARPQVLAKEGETQTDRQTDITLAEDAILTLHVRVRACILYFLLSPGRPTACDGWMDCLMGGRVATS